MYVQSECPCCLNRSFKSFLALTSPFIAEFVLEEPPSPTALLECKACHFRFFKHRFTDEEATRLYQGYRGPDYFRVRNRFEPWYTKHINDSIGSNPVEIAVRKRLASGFIRSYIRNWKAGAVLDYGGDRGQFIPDDIASDKYVFDISGAVPEAGVTALSSVTDLRKNRYDLIMLCHVLEHLSEPASILEELRSLSTNSSAFYFVEVPYERFSMPFSSENAALRWYLTAIGTMPAPILTAIDFYSTAVRTKLALVPPLGFPKLSEHINFFDVSSLTALLQRCGFEVVACRVMNQAKTTVGIQGTLLCVARSIGPDRVRNCV
uniref:Uncharacterized protein n=1 Tax=mine drainage metagenome TaxID=410659 RepID=E6PD92_9ZZZZ